jgi:two-component system, cell cycle response regulator
MSILDSRSRVLACAFAAVGSALALHAAHALFDLGHPTLDSFVTNWVYTAIELAAFGLCAARAICRREDRAAWVLITLGLIGWSCGDFVWTIWLNNVAEPPYPSIADPFYLAMYPALYAGLVLLMRSRFRHAGAALWLDGIVVGLTLAAIGADLIFPAIHATSSDETAAIVLNLTYLLCDLLLLVFLAVGFALSGWRPGRQWLALAFGVLVLACADMLFLYQEAHGTYVAGRILDTMWPASMALLALAAWQPAPARRSRTIAGRHTVMLPTIFGLIALALLVRATLQSDTELAVALATCALLAAGVRAALTYLENVRMLERQTRDAITDALTGLGNRRHLLEDLELAIDRGPAGPGATLAFFDLNGFKRYNDSFGHGAGDALLARLGATLAAAVGVHGAAYRLGGDEFCVLLESCLPRSDALLAKARAALSEQGSGFTVTASCGVVMLPRDASTVTLALNLADERMYADKGAGSRTGQSQTQTQSVLMQLLTEREPLLHDHVCDVGQLSVTIGRTLGLDSEELDELRRAAELHDIGKLAVPEEILHKPGSLSESELAFMRQHTIVGERILNVAPALRVVARLVRSSHERFDGEGYPDGLAGTEIPIGSRIIAACDAYDAMVSHRPYQAPRTSAEAIVELRRHAGSQFDPDVVRILCHHLESVAPTPLADLRADVARPQ